MNKKLMFSIAILFVMTALPFGLCSPPTSEKKDIVIGIDGGMLIGRTIEGISSIYRIGASVRGATYTLSDAEHDGWQKSAGLIVIAVCPNEEAAEMLMQDRLRGCSIPPSVDYSKEIGDKALGGSQSESALFFRRNNVFVDVTGLPQKKYDTVNICKKIDASIISGGNGVRCGDSKSLAKAKIENIVVPDSIKAGTTIVVKAQITPPANDSSLFVANVQPAKMGDKVITCEYTIGVHKDAVGVQKGQISFVGSDCVVATKDFEYTVSQ